MKIVDIYDATTGRPFPSFMDKTTRVVCIPHEQPSQVQVQWDRACRVCVSSGNQDVACEDAPNGEARIRISELQAPSDAQTLAALVLPLFRKPGCSHRLYCFEVVITENTPAQDEHKFSFHILCPDHFAVAQQLRQRTECEPGCIEPDPICERAEGRPCSHCRPAPARTTGARFFPG